MAFRPLARLGARLLSIVLLAGCARDAASPVEPTAIPPKPNAALLGLLPVRGVTRASPLANDITVSAVIGSKGGTLSIPEAGLTLVVPANAVAKNTTFKATAVAGKIVAYEFEPHGTTFAVPLKFTQDLRKVSLLSALTAPLMDGAYFADRSQLYSPGSTLSLVSELQPVVVNLLKSQASFPINHFSGYLISWH
jgi:hypothetical protein